MANVLRVVFLFAVVSRAVSADLDDALASDAECASEECALNALQHKAVEQSEEEHKTEAKVQSSQEESSSHGETWGPSPPPLGRQAPAYPYYNPYVALPILEILGSFTRRED